MKTFHDVCKAIVASTTTSPYAKAYAQAGLRMHQPEDLEAQSLYILSNLSTWRDEQAKRAREILKQYT